MQEFQYDDPVRIRLTGERGRIVQINRGRDFPYVVRVVTPKTHVAEAGAFNISEVRCEAFCAAALEPCDAAGHLTPPSGGTSGGHAADAAPYRTGVRMPISESPAQSAETAEALKLIRWRMTEIANAIEKRPTTLQLAAIIALAFLALSAAMKIAGGWS